LDPLDAIEWNNKGITYHGMKLFEEANEAYDRAIAIDPENPIFWNNKEKLSRDIRKQKSTKLKTRSDDSPQKEKKSKLEYAIYWNNKGAALYHQGFESEALAAFDRAISLDPTHPIFWKNKAKVLKKTGHEEDAKTAIALSDAIITEKDQKNSEEAIEWNNKGYTFAEDGKHEEAITAFNCALESNPGFAEAWNNKGYSLAELGRTDEAITACCRAIELNPAFARSWIENWFSFKEMACEEEESPSLHDLFESDDKMTLSEATLLCDHRSGPIEMERVFIRSDDKMGKYIPCGWICPDCGQYQRE